MLNQAREHGAYAAIEGEVDGDPRARREGALRLRVVRPIPDASTSLLQPAERFLQLTQPVPPTLAHNADAVQRAYREYQEKSLGRTGLRKMYIGTLTLALFLATFIAMMLALALGQQLARPLFCSRRARRRSRKATTRRSARSRRATSSAFTQSFNAMTRQLSKRGSRSRRTASRSSIRVSREHPREPDGRRLRPVGWTRRSGSR